MADPDDTPKGFDLFGESIEVTDLSTGRRVDLPDIAAKGIGAMTQAVEAAGGSMDSSNVRAIRPGTITGYAPRDPSFELAIDYGVPCTEAITSAGFVDVDPIITEAPVSTESGVTSVVARLINLDRFVDGETAITLLDVTGFRPATAIELIAFASQHGSWLYQDMIPALGTQFPGGSDGSTLVAVLHVREWAKQLVLERFDDDWDRACRFLAVAN